MATPLTVAEDGLEIMKLLGMPETSSPYVVESSSETEPLKPVRNQFETGLKRLLNALRRFKDLKLTNISRKNKACF